jgi:uncharacterized protein YaiI (UPF0178 family)
VIYVDADACPVRAEVERVATRWKVQVAVVSNGGLRPSQNPFVDTIVVADGLDVADRWIVERAGPGDVVITADVPLSSDVIEKGATVLSPNGERLTAVNIGAKRATRDLMTDLRAANPLGTGGGAKPFSKADRSRFLDALDQVLRQVERKNP